jgi:hypothetical protein
MNYEVIQNSLNCLLRMIIQQLAILQPFHVTVTHQWVRLQVPEIVRELYVQNGGE